MGKVVQALWVWLMLDDDGDEGIPAFVDATGTWVPLIAADGDRLRSLRPMAETVARETKRRVVLYRFAGAREWVDEFDPEEGVR